MPNTARKRTWIARSAFCYPEVVKVAARPLTGRNARDLHRQYHERIALQLS